MRNSLILGAVMMFAWGLYASIQASDPVWIVLVAPIVVIWAMQSNERKREPKADNTGSIRDMATIWPLVRELVEELMPSEKSGNMAMIQGAKYVPGPPPEEMVNEAFPYSVHPCGSRIRSLAHATDSPGLPGGYVLRHHIGGFVTMVARWDGEKWETKDSEGAPPNVDVSQNPPQEIVDELKRRGISIMGRIVSPRHKRINELLKERLSFYTHDGNPDLGVFDNLGMAMDDRGAGTMSIIYHRVELPDRQVAWWTSRGWGVPSVVSLGLTGLDAGLHQVAIDGYESADYSLRPDDAPAPGVTDPVRAPGRYGPAVAVPQGRKSGKPVYTFDGDILGGSFYTIREAIDFAEKWPGCHKGSIMRHWEGDPVQVAWWTPDGWRVPSAKALELTGPPAAEWEVMLGGYAGDDLWSPTEGGYVEAFPDDDQEPGCVASGGEAEKDPDDCKHIGVKPEGEDRP